MQIKRIDIHGFKSFCDRSTLDMRQRMTGVVGPNGCGKSNIVDALRWAMGELSARHLRGKLMEDVIFAGSDSRGPSGTAEVSITFENDGRAPAEYIGYDEITVTRRYHRDNTSEFLINQLPVRLRDIANLFLGTGVGTKAYAIIEQGRVGLIVSAKPEDRRHFIDEAAGITKYRKRRVAAERKMDATRQNLLRVSDVLEEVGSRLGSLRRQAKKAARYKQYKTEMHDIELWSASHSLLEFIAEAKVVDSAIVALEAEREDADFRLQSGEADLETARIEAADEERRLSALQEGLYQLDNRIKLTENAIEFHRHEAGELSERAQSARSEAAELTSQLALVDEEHASVAIELDKSRQRRLTLQAELETKQEVLSRVREEAEQVDEQIEIERQDGVEAERAVARAEANLRALDQRREDLRERIERRRQEQGRVLDRLAELRASQTTIDGQLGSLRLTRSQIEERHAGARSTIDELGEVAKRGESELEVLRTELHRRRSRLASLREIQQRYEGFGRGTRAIMQRVNGDGVERGILGLVADIIEAPPAYETALEAVLDQRLGTVIVEDEKIGVEAIEYLKTNAEGRSSFISRRSRGPSMLDQAPVGVVWEQDGGMVALPPAPPVALHPGVHGTMMGLIQCKNDYEPVADSLLGDVVVVESLDRGLSVWEEMPEQTLVTLDGEILDPTGTLTGGSADAETSGVLSQKREIKELTEIIARLESDYEQALDAHITVKTELATAQQVLEETTRDGHQGDKEILTHEKDLGRVAEEITSLERRQRELDVEFEQLQGLLDDVDRDERGFCDEIRTATAKQHLCADVGALLLRERLRCNTVVDEAATTVTETHVAVAQAEASCDAVAERKTQLELMHQERSERIARLEQGASEDSARADDLRDKVEQLQDELQQAVTERAVRQDELEQRRTAFSERSHALAELEGDLKQLRSQVTALGKSVNEHQLQAGEQRMRRQHLEEQIWERYREVLTAAAGDYHLRPPVTEQQLARLDQLRRLIRRMGEINLTAIEEYEQLNERFEFLTTHRDDLEGALNQLQRAIQKINRTCRKRFKETFDAVDAKFQEIFPRLFAGGKAKLVLTDPDGDVLTGGVDIVAQPPGKKLQSIEMMSGGEKALTAVSLIFAMFLVKPSPFCLLDEVDAPLDEANVVRFCEMIREMSETSQFIIITHNRRTMELAESLYGVTMEEPGISKLVSVNLSDATKVVAA